MIVIDIETSGIYPEKHGIWQIGALDFYNPKNIFLDESRIDDKDSIEDGALKVTGKTEAQLRDKNKQSQKQLIENFYKWTRAIKIKSVLCHNNAFDVAFINYKTRKYGIEGQVSELDPHSLFHHRSFDLHSIASFRYFQVNGFFLISEDHSDMGLSSILKFCGLEDNRIKIYKGDVVKEGSTHNALEDAKLTAECFSRLIYGKSLFEEYSEYKLPKYLEGKK